MKVVKVEDLAGLVGQNVGASDWTVVEQDRINQFADVTEDHQFIHIDPEKAKMTPFGSTIAHGFLTLSLLAKFAEQGAIVLDGTKMGVNYGFDKVRFLAPVKVGKKIRGHFKIKSVDEKRPGQFLITYEVSVEIDGEETPALIADWMAMQFVG